MSKIEFVSHAHYIEDEYTKEAVYLCLEGKYRVLYIRKAAKNGGLFWSVPTVAVTKNGRKEFLESFMQDSNFLEKDIKSFLEARSWEGKSAHTASQAKSTELWYQKGTRLSDAEAAKFLPTMPPLGEIPDDDSCPF